jgi:hypothetical protein
MTSIAGLGDGQRHRLAKPVSPAMRPVKLPDHPGRADRGGLVRGR